VVKAKTKQGGTNTFWIAVIGIAAVGAGVLGYLVSNRKPQVVTLDPTLPKVDARGYTIGKADAPVEIIEFADYECPVCAQYAAVTEPDVRSRLVETGLVKYTYYDFPLDMHPNTLTAMLGAACADDQGKFWEMHDRIYQGQLEWNTQATKNPRSVIAGYAKGFGLDMTAWDACFDSKKHLPRIQASQAAAVARGLNGTPAFIVGDKLIPGNAGYDLLKSYVDSAMAKRNAAAPAAPAAK
jgi:protein-disulfide isomerase